MSDRKKHLSKEIESRNDVMKEFPMLERAAMVYKAQLFDSFTKLSYDSQEDMAAIHRQMVVIDTVIAKLKKIIDTGDMAIEQIQQVN